MALNADTLLDRMQLKHQISKWRTIAIVAAALAVVAAIGRTATLPPFADDYIARVSIEGIIVDDEPMLNMLDDLADDDNVQAVIVKIDSPGGTVVGGEEMYLALRRISKEKPVVITMRSLCTSAGYMTALGGDYLIAREGTITGSIGVIMQAMEFTKLADKLGVTPITVKSGPNKAVPNPFETITQGQREIVEAVVDDFYGFFVELVVKRRKLDETQVRALADGRIFTGAQALDAKLIDAIGGEKEAIAWLAKEHKIDKDTDIIEIEPKRKKQSVFSDFEQIISQSLFSIKNLPLRLDGLASIWHPASH